MRKIFLIGLASLLFNACKKETALVEHKVQLQSNIDASASTYLLMVKGVPETDLNKEYTLLAGESVQLTLTRDTVTTWLNATIFQDGEPVKYDAGYKDIQLELVIPAE